MKVKKDFSMKKATATTDKLYHAPEGVMYGSISLLDETWRKQLSL